MDQEEIVFDITDNGYDIKFRKSGIVGKFEKCLNEDEMTIAYGIKDVIVNLFNKVSAINSDNDRASRVSFRLMNKIHDVINAKNIDNYTISSENLIGYLKDINTTNSLKISVIQIVICVTKLASFVSGSSDNLRSFRSEIGGVIVGYYKHKLLKHQYDVNLNESFKSDDGLIDDVIDKALTGVPYKTTANLIKQRRKNVIKPWLSAGYDIRDSKSPNK